MLRILAFVGICGMASAQTSQPQATPKANPSAVATLKTTQLQAFADNPAEVRSLIESCLALTLLNLNYKFGSANPTNGGMDCSGTIYYVLRELGVKDVPRTASGQYVWARKAGTFKAVISRKMGGFEFDDLRPGDLLFWTGTYNAERDPPVSHTMVYLGKRRKDGKPVMFGASDGRSYQGRQIWGVSVFDFVLPKARTVRAGSKGTSPGSVFIGYAAIPGLKKDLP